MVRQRLRADTWPPRAHAVVDLLRREAAVLLAHELDHEPTGASAAAAQLPEARQGGVGPGATLIMIPVLKDVLRWHPMRAAFLLVLALCLVGCSGAQGHPKGAVVASFYPLAWAAEQVLRRRSTSST